MKEELKHMVFKNGKIVEYKNPRIKKYSRTQKMNMWMEEDSEAYNEWKAGL